VVAENMFKRSKMKRDKRGGGGEKIKINVVISHLTLNPLMFTIVAPSSNASKWQMGFNLAFKALKLSGNYIC
jgi:hypothetical protein